MHFLRNSTHKHQHLKQIHFLHNFYIIKHNIIYLEKLSCFLEDIPLYCEVYNVYQLLFLVKN